MNTRIIIPVVAAVLALVAWLLHRDSYDGHKHQYLWPLGTFIGVFVLGHVAVGVVQGMREASKKRSGNRPAKRP